MASPGLASQDAAAGLSHLRAAAAPKQHAPQCLADVAKLSHFSVNSKAYKLVFAAGIIMPHSCPVRRARGEPHEATHGTWG
jgi:hypothetical protein